MWLLTSCCACRSARLVQYLDGTGLSFIPSFDTDPPLQVTPVYFVLFTVSTIVSSTILYQGFKASPVDIVTVVFGFFVICVSLSSLLSEAAC